MPDHTQQFYQALETSDLDILKNIPKTDFHRHSFLGTHRYKIQAWNGVILPPPEHLVGMKGLRQYLQDIVYPHLDNREGFEFTALSSIEDAIEDGITTLEMSFDTRFSFFYTDRVDGFISFIRALKNNSGKKINFKPEIGISRSRGQACINVALECIDSGVFSSIDLYGDERESDSQGYIELFKYAKRKGLKLKAHTGEFDGAESVRKNVELLELDEVQHGIRATESVDVMKWLSKNKIRLNICPTSNIILNVYNKIEDYPVKKLLDHGVAITISSDDPTVFDKSVSDEYLNLYQFGLLTREELNSIRIDALKPSRF